jgi:ATP-binding cassette subfamily B protein
MTNDDGERPSSVRHLFAQLTEGHRLRYAVIGLTTVAGGLAEAAVLVLAARMASRLAAGHSRVAVPLGPVGTFELSIGALLAIAMGLTLVRLATQAATVWQMTSLTTMTLTSLRKASIRLFLQASWGLQSSERVGHLQELMTTSILNVCGAVLHLITIEVSLLLLVVLLGAALAVNFLASLLVIGALVGLALVLRPLRPAVRNRSRITVRRNLAYATAISETSATAREIKIFSVDEEVRKRIDAAIDAHGRAFQRTRFLTHLLPGLYQSMAMLLVIGALGVVYFAASTQLASIGAVILIMLRSFMYGQQLQTAYQALHESAPYLEQLRARQREYRAAAVERGGAPVARVDEIAFDRVWFEYEPSRPVLREVSFDVTRGELIGIVGPTGSGKSTLVQLLLRLREPTSGAVLADGRDVRALSLDDWHRRVSFVPQDARLVSGTVADNIRFFRDHINEPAIQQAAKLAHLHDEIVSWPLGYDTQVGERGDQLSGGQRQRLCIARSLVGSPDVLVLDEPTSALDPSSETLVRETLSALAPRVTVFIIAHRLSTLHTCGRIMVLQDGQLLGFDEPAQLRRSSPFYQEALRLSGLR